MAKRKRIFHCERCGNPCTIYKKGKAHRVLVCPQHGVIATNPLPLAVAAVAGKAALKVGKKVLGKGNPKKEEASATPGRQVLIHDDADKYNQADKIRLALG
jgi:hypothetical protein